MTRYADHGELAAEALGIAEQVRETGPLELYRYLTNQCVRDPERMAQIIMCLGVWLDPDVTTDELIRRAESAVESRVAVVGRAAS